VDLTNVRRRLPKGDKLDGETIAVRNQTYYYSNIPGTDFSFAYVFQTGSDDNFRVAIGTGSGNDGLLRAAGDDFYHRLEKYTAPNVPASRVADLAMETRPANDRLYPGLSISTRHSAYKLAPSSFCEAEQYILDVGASAFPLIDAFMRADYANTSDTYPNVGCPVENSTVVTPTPGSESESQRFSTQLQVRPDVELTHAVDAIWRDVTSTTTLWRFTSTVQGVFRIFPGTRMPHLFNPTRRSWYRRGVAS